MKNLKKAFSLVLAAAMLCSLMVFNAGAAYSDATDVTNTEAVDTVSALKIMGGYPDGSFQPEKIVTRAEMAKMICVALNGGKDPMLGATSSRYKDTVGHWAAGYIEYCSNLGVIGGFGDGTFKPDTPVTGSQAAKMLLVTIGYDAETEGFVGDTWEIAVNVRANQKDFYENLNINPSAGLAREDAAQMIFNAIQADKVEYDYKLVTGSNGQLTTAAVVKDITPAESILTDEFGVTKFEGVLAANQYGYAYGGSPLEKGYTTIDTNPSNGLGNDLVSLKVTSSADDIGKAVTVYAKNLTSGSYKDVFGPFVSDEVTVVTFTSKPATQTKMEDTLKAAGIKSIPNPTPTLTNYTTAGTITTGFAGLFGQIGNGIVVNVIKNTGSATTADYIQIVKKTVGKVTTYSTSGDGVIFVAALTGAQGPNTWLTSQKMENVVGYENIAKDDIVLYYNVGAKYYVEKCDSLTATVSAKQGSDILAGGTTYKGSALNNDYDDLGASSIAAATTLNEDAKLYFDAHGYVVFIDEVEASSNYMLVTAQNITGTGDFRSVKVMGVLEDGTKVTATVSHINDVKVTHVSTPTPVTNDIYRYSVNSDGTYKITALTTVDGAINSGVDQVKKGNPDLTRSTNVGTAYTADSKTIFVIKNGDNYDVYTGISNVASLGDTAAPAFTSYTYCKTGTVATIVYVTVSSYTGGTGTAVYILDNNPTITVSGGTYTYVYKALVNGEPTDLTATETSSSISSPSKGLYKDVRLVGGKLDVSSMGTAVPGAKATFCKNGVLTISGVGSFSYNSDTKVFVVDGKTVTEGSIGEINVVVEGSPDPANSTVAVIPTKDAGSDTSVADQVYILK